MKQSDFIYRKDNDREPIPARNGSSSSPRRRVGGCSTFLPTDQNLNSQPGGFMRWRTSLGLMMPFLLVSILLLMLGGGAAWYFQQLQNDSSRLLASYVASMQ